jgi:F-type H+-transporting ATPase subunit b
MPQFDINFYYSQIFWLVVIFGCLYLLVYYFITPVAENLLNTRQNFIDDNISNAENLAKKAKSINQQYASELAKILIKAEDIKKEAGASMEAFFLSKKTQLNNELKAQIQNSNLDNEATKKLFWTNQSELCISLAVFLIQKITNKEVNMELLRESYNKIL